MLKEFFQWFQGELKPNLYSVNELRYSDKVLNPVKPLLSESVRVSTLGGLVDYLKSKYDRLDGKHILLHVESYKSVIAFSELNAAKDRDHYIKATLDMYPDSFQFGKWMSQDRMIIGLLSQFVRDEAVSELVSKISKVKVDKGLTCEDDGITQHVQMRTGVHLMQQGELPSVVNLSPYRTFREVDQPESKFIFRAKYEEGELPTFALFEADGGAWKLNAMENVAEFLSTSNLPEYVKLIV